MEYRTFACVWDAVEPDPVKRVDLRLRSILLCAVQDYILGADLSQADLTRQLEISKAQLQHLRQSHIYMFQLSDLVALCVRAGLKIEVIIKATDSTAHYHKSRRMWADQVN